MTSALRLVFLAVPDIAIEAIARTAGYLTRFHRDGRELRAEGKIRGWFLCKRLGCSRLFVGRSVILEGAHAMHIGTNVRINHAVHIACGTKGMFSIGDNSHIGRQSVVAAGGGVEIGRNCAISSHVSIFSVSNAPDGLSDVEERPRVQMPVRIGDGVFIGAGAVILPGVTIGPKAVIGAGAVVLRDVEAGAMIGGVPAKPLASTRKI